MSKLEDRQKKYNIPAIPYLPRGDRVLIWRILPEQKTAGGLYVPEAHQGVKSHGIIVAAGLAARDVMADALIELGDDVYFGEYAGRDRKLEGREATKTSDQLLECLIQDVNGSYDAVARADDYDIVRIATEDGERLHVYEKKNTKRKAA